MPGRTFGLTPQLLQGRRRTLGRPSRSQQRGGSFAQRPLFGEVRATRRAVREVSLERRPLPRGQLAVEVRVQRSLIHVRHAVLLPVLYHTLRPISGARAPTWFQSRRAPIPSVRRSRRTTSRHPTATAPHGPAASARRAQRARSEERRVGKECRSRWSPYH